MMGRNQGHLRPGLGQPPPKRPFQAGIPFGHSRSLARNFSIRRCASSMFRNLRRFDSSLATAPGGRRSIGPSRRAAQPTEAVALWSSASIDAHLSVRARSAAPILARREAQSCFALARPVSCGFGMLNPPAGASNLIGREVIKMQVHKCVGMDGMKTECKKAASIDFADDGYVVVAVTKSRHASCCSSDIQVVPGKYES
jgi:hypothetical protein